MPSIQSLGVGSGLLTSELVEDIIAAEREATDLRIGAKRAEVEAKISAFGAVRSGISNLATAADALGSSDTLLSTTVNSTNASAVNASADAQAVPGTHTVEVLATARAHTLTTQRYDAIDAVVGEGTLDFRFGATTFVNGAYDTFTENPERASANITIDATNNTLSGIRDAINAADFGVSANIINDGQGYVLVLTSDQTGENHSMEISVTAGAVAGLEALAFNAGASVAGTNLTQTVDADDAVAIIDGLTVSRETNQIADVIDGVTFDLFAATPGTPVTLTVSQDTAAITERMNAFVEAYNSLKVLTDELTAYSEEDESGGLLTGDATLRSLLSQLTRSMVRGVSDVENTGLRALVDLGIASDENNNFLLSFNATTFQSALAASSNDVLAVLAEQTRASDSGITFAGFTNNTQAGSYLVDISRAATQASYSGAVVAGLSGPITIDADNDSLSVTVDGVASGSIDIAQGSYTDGDSLATAIEAAINLDANLRAAQVSVSVGYDDSAQTLQIASTSYGSGSNIGIDSVDTNVSADLGLVVVTSTSNVGLDVAGTINGVEGQGTGQFLSIPSGPQAATAGIYKGAAVTSFDAGPLTLDADNNRFRLSVDGILSNDVVLTTGSYASGADLAVEVAAQINADTTLSASGLSVSVAYDAADERFEITSGSEGVGSSVNLTYALAGTVGDLGLTVGVGEPGANASAVADAAAGIGLQVQGAATGERGTVTLVRGIMNQIASLLGAANEFGGTLSSKVQSFDSQLADLDEEAQTFGDRMDQLEERLRFQFAAADALISTLNNTSSFLDSQLASLPGYSRDA